jgi:hypothetical protein
VARATAAGPCGAASRQPAATATMPPSDQYKEAARLPARTQQPDRNLQQGLHRQSKTQPARHGRRVRPARAEQRRHHHLRRRDARGSGRQRNVQQAVEHPPEVADVLRPVPAQVAQGRDHPGRERIDAELRRQRRDLRAPAVPAERRHPVEAAHHQLVNHAAGVGCDLVPGQLHPGAENLPPVHPRVDPAGPPGARDPDQPAHDDLIAHRKQHQSPHSRPEPGRRNRRRGRDGQPRQLERHGDRGALFAVQHPDRRRGKPREHKTGRHHHQHPRDPFRFLKEPAGRSRQQQARAGQSQPAEQARPTQGAEGRRGDSRMLQRRHDPEIPRHVEKPEDHGRHPVEAVHLGIQQARKTGGAQHPDHDSPRLGGSDQAALGGTGATAR